MPMFNRKSEPTEDQPLKPSAVTQPPNGKTVTPSSGVLSRGVSINGSVKFLNELAIDGEVEGSIDSPGKLYIGEHGQIKGEIRAKSVKVHGNVEGDIFASERCELQAGSVLRGDIEA